MRPNGLTVFLMILFLAGVVATASMAYTCVRTAQSVGRMQSVAAAINRDRGRLQALAAEAVEYGKRNPSIEPILEGVGIKIKPALGNPGK